MNKFKKQIALVLAFCMLFSSFAVGTKASAHENDYDANQEDVVIENYLTFENNQFIVDSERMLKDGIFRFQILLKLSREYNSANGLKEGLLWFL